MRRAFITAALDAGVPLRDVQDAASHADPRTTMRYDRARVSLDRHATYIVATFIAGASRYNNPLVSRSTERARKLAVGAFLDDRVRECRWMLTFPGERKDNSRAPGVAVSERRSTRHSRSTWQHGTREFVERRTARSFRVASRKRRRFVLGGSGSHTAESRTSRTRGTT